MLYSIYHTDKYRCMHTKFKHCALYGDNVTDKVWNGRQVEGQKVHVCMLACKYVCIKVKKFNVKNMCISLKREQDWNSSSSKNNFENINDIIIVLAVACYIGITVNFIFRIFTGSQQQQLQQHGRVDISPSALSEDPKLQQQLQWFVGKQQHVKTTVIRKVWWNETVREIWVIAIQKTVQTFIGNRMEFYNMCSDIPYSCCRFGCSL